MRRLRASSGEGRSGGSGYRDTCWVCGSNLASEKAQSPDWIARSRLRSPGASSGAAGGPDSRIEKRRSSPSEQREADLHKVFRFQSALPIVVMYADRSGVTTPWFSMNDPADNILHAADSGRMAQLDAST